MESTATNQPPSIDSLPPKVRDPWLDIFRGLAIILMVAGHVIGGLTNTPYISASEGFREIYDWMYTCFFLGRRDRSREVASLARPACFYVRESPFPHVPLSDLGTDQPIHFLACTRLRECGLRPKPFGENALRPGRRNVVFVCSVSAFGGLCDFMVRAETTLDILSALICWLRMFCSRT